MTRRIGIYSGTFDPVHEGHISFAIATTASAHLDRVYFLPERIPRHKPAVSHYESRVAGLSDAAAAYPQLAILELPDRALTIQETLPELSSTFIGATLVFLVGADTLAHMHTWPKVDVLTSSYNFAIGVRRGWDESKIIDLLRSLSIPASRYTIVRTDYAHVSSTMIREQTS